MVPKPQTLTGVPRVKAEAPAPVKALPTLLPKELFRGTPLHTCLAGFGKHWKSSVSHDTSDFAWSEEVEFLDDFLSHDWATSRWAKFCAMLVVYNSWAACVATIIPTIWAVFGKMLFAPDVPQEQTVLMFCIFELLVPVVFFLFLLFWQSIKNIFTKPSRVFLDKLCISQHDLQKKEAGIAGLAGFLSNSRRMVILWSPKYFSRLWCTYEIGAFLRLHKRKDVEIIPASFGAFLCTASLVLTSIWLLIIGHHVVVFAFIQESLYAVLFFNYAEPVLYLLALFGGFWFYIKSSHSLAQLFEQLSRFSIRDSQCFCCSVDHCMPGTGEEILCDRRVVYGTLGMWYSGDEWTDPLDMFDQEVRLQLTEFVAEQFGNGYFPFAYFARMVVLPLVMFEVAHYGTAVISPSTALLAENPRVADLSFRMTVMLHLPCKYLLGLFLMVALTRLTERMCCKSCLKRCLLLRVTLLVLVTLVLILLERIWFTWLQWTAVEACVAYSVFVAVLLGAGLRKMGARSQRKSTQRPTVDEPTVDEPTVDDL